MPIPSWILEGQPSRRDVLMGFAAMAMLPIDFRKMSQQNRGYRSIRLRADSLEPMHEFYGSALKLPTKLERGLLTVRVGSTDLVFTKAETGRPYYHFAFNIPENKIEAACDWLKKRTPVVKLPGSGEEIVHFQNWNAHAVYFFDPAGNIVEFIARHTLPNATKGAFSESEVLYASELGWVVEDVAKAVQQIESGLGIKPYRNPGDEAAAVGDEHALLIVVKKGRIWLGTKDLAASPFEAQAEIALSRTGSVSDAWVKIRGNP